ncbi:hypothetical protein FDP41_001263 [Naegleria fowleri]|uniref:Thioredoxin domain-containing protein n=1 Tax=Naegleria fowleri TaxID=5763 RepID=A0A6A5C250_NAEFO|nr:uncharacterized protein FDP41_001263 [Naegleria fowleri]KAF0979595.1 hypothetical protein FDP41_001263 [Naegleria fowleri]CAG4710214.1 unnamed protein product [Naegleria fowleri]
MRKKPQEKSFQTTYENVQDWEKALLHNQNTPNHVLVVDVHASWCGKCLSILPVFEKMHVEYSDEHPLSFGVLDSEKILAELHDLMKPVPRQLGVPSMQLRGSSKNLLVLGDHEVLSDDLKKKKLYKEDVKRKNYKATLESCSGLSEPHFLIFKEGELMRKVRGVNTPSLQRFIVQLITNEVPEKKEEPLEQGVSGIKIETTEEEKREEIKPEVKQEVEQEEVKLEEVKQEVEPEVKQEEVKDVVTPEKSNPVIEEINPPSENVTESENAQISKELNKSESTQDEEQKQDESRGTESGGEQLLQAKEEQSEVNETMINTQEDHPPLQEKPASTKESPQQETQSSDFKSESRHEEAANVHSETNSGAEVHHEKTEEVRVAKEHVTPKTVVVDEKMIHDDQQHESQASVAKDAPPRPCENVVFEEKQVESVVSEEVVENHGDVPPSTESHSVDINKGESNKE